VVRKLREAEKLLAEGADIATVARHLEVPVLRVGQRLHRAGEPVGEPFIESFNGKLRDELLNVEAFETLLEAQVLAEDFRIGYNTYRPHSSLGGLTPFEFAEQWRQNQPGLSQLDH